MKKEQGMALKKAGSDILPAQVRLLCQALLEKLLFLSP